MINNIQTKDYERSANQSDDLSFNVSFNDCLVGYFITSWIIKMTDSNEPKDKITNFADFQTANIKKISDEIAGMTGEEALVYIQELIERFSFEIWNIKERSFAAEVLKNQIKKTIEAEKGKLLPEYNPANLSKVTRSKKIQTSKEEKEDKTLALFIKSGLSREQAQELISKSLSQTYEKGISTEPPKVEYDHCPKCKAINFSKTDRCSICSTWLRSCDYCKATSLVDSKTCEEHKNEGKVIKPTDKETEKM